MQEQPGTPEPAATGTTVKVPADQIKFVTSGIRQHGGEIFLGRAFGDVQNGKHGTFMKFTAGFHSLRFDAQTLEKE